MRRLALASLLLLLLPFCLTAEGSCVAGRAPVLSVTAAAAGAAVLPAAPARGLEAAFRGHAWAIVGDLSRLLRGDNRALAAGLYAWLPPLALERPRRLPLPPRQLPQGRFALLRIGTVQLLV